MSNRSPLEWPIGVPRTKYRDRSVYKVSPGAALKHLLVQARLLSGSFVLTSNARVNRDGNFYADELERKLDDPGIALYWTDGKKLQRSIAVDQFGKLWENMRALGLAIEALRTLQRTGASQVLDRVFSAFIRMSAAFWRSASESMRILALMLVLLGGNRRRGSCRSGVLHQMRD